VEEFLKEGGDGQRLQALLMQVLGSVMKACATV
jgi:hypothetical protein